MDATAAFRRAVAQLGGPAAGGLSGHGKGESSGSHGTSGKAAILPPMRAKRRRSPFAQRTLELVRVGQTAATPVQPCGLALSQTTATAFH